MRVCLCDGTPRKCWVKWVTSSGVVLKRDFGSETREALKSEYENALRLLFALKWLDFRFGALKEGRNQVEQHM